MNCFQTSSFIIHTNKVTYPFRAVSDQLSHKTCSFNAIGEITLCFTSIYIHIVFTLKNTAWKMVTLQIPHQNRFGKIIPASQHL